MAAADDDSTLKRKPPVGLRFYDEDVLKQMFRFAPDMARRNTEVNRLNNQVLVRYFEKEWSKYTQQ
jgi:spermidine synthase